VFTNSYVQIGRRVAVAIGLSAVAALGASVPARADGDPASDVLISQQLFLPADANLSPTLAAQLATAVQQANTGGYSIRVAVIASRVDLGSVTALWRKPMQYARFLGEELVGLYEGRLLIAMPNGLGFFDAQGAPAAEARVARQVRVASGPDALGRAAIAALARLDPAAAVRARPAGGASGASPVVWIGAVGGAAVAAAGGALVLRRRSARR
jgi:hypothetical protein